MRSIPQSNELTEASRFSLLRRQSAAIDLADYVIAELGRDRALMAVLDDPAVRAITDGREYLLGDLACDGLFLDALRDQRERGGGDAGEPAKLHPRRLDPDGVPAVA